MHFLPVSGIDPGRAAHRLAERLDPFIEQPLCLCLGSELEPSVPVQLLAQELLPQLDDLAE